MNPEAQAEALKVSRARRDEEWQKIRNPDVVTEKDKEEDFETKTLYERLQENRELKRAEIEEQFRYKNMVYSGLDNDEHKFLEAWEENKKKETSDRMKMDVEELQKFKARIVDLEAKSSTVTQLATPNQPKANVVSKQKRLLSGVVKRKKTEAITAIEESTQSSSTINLLAGLTAYSDSESDSSKKSRDSSKQNTQTMKKSESSSSSSSSGSGSSSDSSDSSGPKRKKVRKPSWENRRHSTSDEDETSNQKDNINNEDKRQSINRGNPAKGASSAENSSHNDVTKAESNKSDSESVNGTKSGSDESDSD